MICNTNAACGDYQEYVEDCACAGNSFGNYNCIVNLIIILIVLQFLTSIINSTGCGNGC